MINGIKWYILIAGKGNPQDRSKSHVIDGEGSLPKLPSANITLVQYRFESCRDMDLQMLPGIHILRSLLKLLTAIYF